MAKTVDNAFAIFNTDTVNIQSKRTEKARGSRDWLINQIEALPSKDDTFPDLYDGKHIRYGSFARNTKIAPLDDIDLIVCYKAMHTGYTIYEYGKNYILNVPQNATKLRALCNQDNTLNSIKLVNKLKAALIGIEHYSSAEIHRRQEAVTLQLSSYEWNFDIVPALYTDTGYYLIPDGSGGWKASDPRVDQKRVKDANAKHSGKILQIIRNLKHWNQNAAMPTIPSYLFENIILNHYNSIDPISSYVDIELRNFWYYLQTIIYNPVIDPKGFQGDLNNLSWDEMNKISAKAKDAYEKASEARTLESTDQEKAIKKWGEILGPSFPKFG